jgi:hypothetical protein
MVASTNGAHGLNQPGNHVAGDYAQKLYSKYQNVYNYGYAPGIAEANL